METKKKKPFQIVIFLLGVLLTVAVFLYQGEIKEAIGFTDINAPYREKYKAYEQTKAVIVSSDIQRGKRGSTISLKVQFRDADGELITSTIDQKGMESFAIGDSLTVYFDPERPQYIVSESSYKNVMGK